MLEVKVLLLGAHLIGSTYYCVLIDKKKQQKYPTLVS